MEAAPSVGNQPKTPHFSPISCFPGSLLFQGFPRAKAARFPVRPAHGMGLGKFELQPSLLLLLSRLSATVGDTRSEEGPFTKNERF